MVVCELETALDKSQAIKILEHAFVPINIRFSSIIVTDDKGVQRWKKVKCSVEDHVVVPTFPPGLTSEEYDSCLEEHISNVYMEVLPADRPPWEVHLIMYPTSKAAGTFVLKLNHAIGDGYSLMGALFSIFKRADNSALPLRFPTASSRYNELSSYSKMSSYVTKCINTFSDFTRGILGTYFEDGKTVLRSKRPKVEFLPVSISSVTFTIDHIREIRSAAGAVIKPFGFVSMNEQTVNDVTTGVIAYALQLYMKRMGQLSGDTHTTAMIAMNLRMYRGFLSLEEMLKANIWGNHSGFLSVTLPPYNHKDIDTVDPLEFVIKSKNEMKRRMNSVSNYFTAKLLKVVGTLRGAEAAAEYLHSNLRNTSITITNMIGPVEQAAISGHAVKNFYFTVPGVPQSLVFTIVSYMGKLRLVATVEKDFIDSKLLVSCLKESFQKIYNAAGGKDLLKFD
ncbi:hypothetical protein GIB67_026773 [Kingdonia uniflora]|uniref:O-acyltransferase WSD1 C-terminal domain-containing protein n=1 Tax=Kingdonia uniflora TaxID=39325 RepID=A0A7J7MHH5_9MAGN|nr:hypothetical protein GIB67_026773 [Kingdonia uniflora]